METSRDNLKYSIKPNQRMTTDGEKVNQETYDRDDVSENSSDEGEQDSSNKLNDAKSLLDSREIPLVYGEFADAYSFRSLIEYLNHTNDDGNFISSPKGLYYSKTSSNNQVLNEVTIHAHELTRFEFNSDKESIVSGMNLGQFKGATKKIGKKDIARLSIFNSAICLQVSGSPKSGSDEDMDVIRTQRLDNHCYVVDGYQNEDEPNCTISMQRFTSVCTDQSSCKDDYILFVGLDRGLITEARQGGNLRASIKTLGQIDDNIAMRSGSFSEKTPKSTGKNVKIILKYPGEIVRYRIPRRIVAALSKLTNISPNGTVKVYMQPSLPIKFVFHISTYGKLAVYLRS